MTEWAKESTHWYKLDGSPFYTLIGKNGKERGVTLADARKLGDIVPSVTTINKLAAAPQLLAWMLRNALLAAATLPKIDGETADAWVERVNTDWKQEGRDARDIGERIHGACEIHYRGGVPDADLFPWVMATKAVILAKCGAQPWSAERSFADADYWYGGKVDLHCRSETPWVIDFKSKDGPAAGRKLWDEEVQQLAAYRRGLGLPTARCAIVHIDRNAPTADFIEASEADLVRGLSMFDCLLSLWKSKNRFDPAQYKVAA